MGFHIVNRLDRTAHAIKPCEFLAGAGFEGFDFSVDSGVAIKEIVIFQEIGFKGHDLLHPHRPLLIPRAGQAEGFIPCGKLHSTGAGFFGKRHGEHFDQDTVDVVLWLLLCKAKRVYLYSIAEAAELGVCDTVTLQQDFIPEVDKGAHFAHFGDKADACVHEKRDTSA